MSTDQLFLEHHKFYMLTNQLFFGHQKFYMLTDQLFFEQQKMPKEIVLNILDPNILKNQVRINFLKDASSPKKYEDFFIDPYSKKYLRFLKSFTTKCENLFFGCSTPKCAKATYQLLGFKRCMYEPPKTSQK